MSPLHRVILETPLPFTTAPLVLTGWKLIGITGALMFTGRWVVQILASRRAGRPTFPSVYWWMSVVGCLMTLSYFIWGKNDAVGILQNLFPSFVASYNLYLDLTHRRTAAGATA